MLKFICKNCGTIWVDQFCRGVCPKGCKNGFSEVGGVVEGSGLGSLRDILNKFTEYEHKGIKVEEVELDPEVVVRLWRGGFITVYGKFNIGEGGKVNARLFDAWIRMYAADGSLMLWQEKTS